MAFGEVAKAAFSAVAAGTCVAGRGPQGTSQSRHRGQRPKKTLQAVVASPTKTQTEQRGDFYWRGWHGVLYSMVLFLLQM